MTTGPLSDHSVDDPSDPARDFDFWVGEWDVVGPDGRLVGSNSITRVFPDGVSGGGAGMLHEHWRGRGGVEGRSLNGYDAARGVWHQTWMDSTGGILVLEGGLRGGAMVLEGRVAREDDPRHSDPQRITWWADGDGMRQLWETSTDDGRTWTVAFDGRYRRRGQTTGGVQPSPGGE